MCDHPDSLGQVAVDRHDQVEGPWLDPVVCQVRADRGDRDTPRLGETSSLREPDRRQVDRGDPEATPREIDPVPSVAVAQRQHVPLGREPVSVHGQPLAGCLAENILGYVVALVPHRLILRQVTPMWIDSVPGATVFSDWPQSIAKLTRRDGNVTRNLVSSVGL